MRQPNNLRNRYRRMVEAVTAYGWHAPSFRLWVRRGMAHPDAYSAQPHHANYTVALTKAVRRQGRTRSPLL